eukprot:6009987-Pleurochrysis_carterae.AAC.1
MHAALDAPFRAHPTPRPVATMKKSFRLDRILGKETVLGINIRKLNCDSSCPKRHCALSPFGKGRRGSSPAGSNKQLEWLRTDARWSVDGMSGRGRLCSTYPISGGCSSVHAAVS